MLCNWKMEEKVVVDSALEGQSERVKRDDRLVKTKHCTLHVCTNQPCISAANTVKINLQFCPGLATTENNFLFFHVKLLPLTDQVNCTGLETKFNINLPHGSHCFHYCKTTMTWFNIY